ncbi:50S ribosomal protein L6 [Thermodesulfobacterium sp.]|jgi:large subunit ribosomal protein L6|uniref:50S ribosomal protein L6 n=1 Tax=Thermodesulfobacterium sp. TaxID=1965289 RepID=UPI0007475965|nr:50S ribosomal protein L6 [Thermodesulfobacterium sp.]KUK37878.1 MAG: 50S ribosomal protein L6 [Thermodesulfobacterium commune]MBZ4682242.1 ribosomal protein [Thermodesulfobacterium sp.]MDK2861977.1 large subunit ribosomal protein [Thermodesulfobacterium sp.]MDN5380217.1 large subunit ribosomal protein [Thermodesulfobacterium sp.]
MGEVSRVGRKPIKIPNGVKFYLKEDGFMVVEGPKGKIEKKLPPLVKVVVEGDTIVVQQDEVRKKLKNKAKAFQGLTRALINNMVIGVTQGFQKVLDIVGLGYKAEVKGDEIVFSLGYSHPINFKLPKGITAKVERGTGEVQVRLTLEGIDKELLGQVAANIRKLRPPEPYKGKGIRYADEVIYRKAGKSGKGAKK